MIFFQENFGRVVKLMDSGVSCRIGVYSFSNETDEITYESHNSIVTRITVSQNVNAQFLHTIGSYVHVYVFGNKMGSIGLAGLAFQCPCVNQTSYPTSHGVGRILDYYKNNNLAVREEPIDIVVGDVNFRSLLTGTSNDVVDVTTGMVQWGMALNTLPEP